MVWCALSPDPLPGRQRLQYLLVSAATALVMTATSVKYMAYLLAVSNIARDVTSVQYQVTAADIAGMFMSPVLTNFYTHFTKFISSSFFLLVEILDLSKGPVKMHGTAVITLAGERPCGR
jgi:hypothetical protein